MCLMVRERFHAASIEMYGSYPYTSIPSAEAAFATIAPMAPRPMIPSFLPMISHPANCFFCFSASLSMSSWSFSLATHSIPPTISREARSIPASTSSFTPFALAPGVLNTTTPFSAQSFTGILLTPAPARAITFTLSGSSMSCIFALLTRTASHSCRSSLFLYSSSNNPRPFSAMGFRQ